MANPQKENGYTAIANELLDALGLVKLTDYEKTVVIHIWRKTYGFSKKEDWISNSQFVLATGINKGNISRTIKSLRNKGIVICRDNKYLRVNKNWEEWKVICRDNKKLSVEKLRVICRATTKAIYTKTNILHSSSKKNFRVRNKPMRIHDPRRFDSDYENMVDLDGNAVDNQHAKDVKQRKKDTDDFLLLLEEYKKGYAKIVGGKIEPYSVHVIRRRFNEMLKLGYSIKDLIELLPAFLDDDFYKKTNWSIRSFLSEGTLSKLKNE